MDQAGTATRPRLVDPERSRRMDMVHHMTDPAAPISITAIDSGLRVSGEIDAHTAPLIADAIEASEHDRLVVDLAEVEFVDSSGLRVLIDAHQQRVGAGRSIVLANPSAVVRRLFEIAGVEGYLDITDEITDAPPS
ncbi:MAG: STAS domain-containing protein [Ilumatobacteraceae bacterium]